jgi:glycosyltransferase involved in cell wall biosynthesis
MISVCIPVYNVNVRPLVTRLLEIGKKSNIQFEIIVLDDASPDLEIQAKNAEIETAENIRYVKVANNVGRNLVRFELARHAEYDHLLFLDADSYINDDLFFTRYLEADWKNKLIIGGRSYSKEQPPTEYLLHWTYGAKREQRTAEIRSTYPYQSFMACNFLISKNQLFTLIIDPKLKGYCHEDTFMGMQFEKNNIPIEHINNPVVHLGLDTTARFLYKQEEALYYLSYIYKKYRHSLPVVKQVKLIQAFEKLKKRRVLQLYQRTIPMFENMIHKNLSSDKPSLFFLDIYKLRIFIDKYLYR